MPNATVYTDVIRVQTANERLRASFTVGVAYETDLERARDIALEAIGTTSGIASSPAPEAILVSLGESTIDLEVLFWCDARQLELRRTRSRAIEAVKHAFDQHGIEMPCRIVALQATSSFQASLHDRTVTPGGSIATADRTDRAST